MMNWHIVTSDVYNAGVKIDGDMYFLSDTKEIYRGEESYSESITFFTEVPVTNIAKNRLYINSNTLEGRVWNGTDWKIVVNPISDTVTIDGSSPVSGKAVAAYVAAEIAKITTSSDVISSLSWDSAEHLLTITKGSTDTENIVFNGLGVNLEYSAETGNLQLLDASGTPIGNAIKLDLERFVSSGEYDPDTQSINLYFDAEKTEFVTIPVGDLVDTYTAEGTNGINLTVEGNVVKGSVKISTTLGNTITCDENGLYVAPVDISSKMDKVTGGVEGDILVLDANGNAVDSGKTFDDITPSGNIFTGTSLETATNSTTPAKGDIAIIITQIGETGKNERKGYIHNGDTWVPFDESYNAENVYFPTDLISTFAIGNISLINGQGTIAAAGKNLKQVWDTIFLKEKNPTITQPSVSISFPQAGAYEVGSTINPSYTATLNPGKYEYNTNNGATGVTATSWEVTDSASHTSSTNVGTFDSFIVEDGTNYKITAKANYGDSPIIPVTNVQNPVENLKIVAGSKSAMSNAVTGYRNAFYGTLTTKGEITSDIIRTLTKTNSAVSAGKALSVNIPIGALRVIIAYPNTIRNITKVSDVNGMGADITSAFTLTEVDVEGVDGYTAVPYKVYYTDLAAANDTVNTYNVTI